jgi:AcrR family transcriptional regulator
MNQQEKTYRLPMRADGKKTFSKIVEAGEKLFSEMGFHAASINEVIAEANIATGTFYLYFNDKKALYLYLIDKYGAEIRKAIRLAIKDTTSRYEEEKKGIEAFLIYALENPIAYRIFWEALYVDIDVFKNYYQNFANDYCKNLSKWVKSGEIRSDVDLETLAYILMGISNFVGLQVLFNPDADEEYINHITEETMKLLYKGMFKK